MRLLFATHDLRLPADLAAGYAGVEVSAVVSSWSDALAALEAATHNHPTEVAILSTELSSAHDLELGLDLAGFLAAARDRWPNLRLVVAGPSTTAVEIADTVGADRFVTYDPDRSSGNLAELLGLVAKSELARVITVTGLQGGAGRTTIAQAIAAGLVGEIPHLPTRGEILLWELDLKHPTIAFDQEFDVLTHTQHGRRTLARLLNTAPSSGDAAMADISASLLSHEQTHLGYDLLLAPHGIREVMALYQTYPNLLELRKRLSAILEAVRRHYQVVILDIGTDLFTDPAPTVALAAADIVIVAATPTPAGLSSIAGMSAILTDLHYQRRSRLVLNRVRRDDALYVEAAKNLAGDLEILEMLPEGATTKAFTALGPKILELEV